MTILRVVPGLLLASTLVVAQTPEPRQTQAPDVNAAALLASARAGLGGDAALDAIHSFVAEGLSESKLWSASFKMSWVRPDKFVIATQQMVGPSYASQMYTSSEGFNGNQLIHQEHRSIVNPVNGGIVIGKRPKAPVPADSQAASDEALAAMRQRFLAFALPFFGQTFDMTPPHFVMGDRTFVVGGDADRIDIDMADGNTISLFIDVVTHRPVQLRGAPSTLTVPSTWTPPPPGDPRKSAEKTEVAMSNDDLVLDFSDYKCAKGVCWPRTFTLSSGKQQLEKVRFSSVDLNAKINPDVFKTSK
jgi:hypothetical protein